MTTKTDTEQERADFEAWISLPPYEKPIGVNPESSGFPGQYRAYEVQLAWEAYQAGRAALQSQDREDVKRLDWLEEQAQTSRTGVSIDYVYDAEDGYVNEKGYRFMRHRFIGPLGKSAREAIDHARRIDGDGNG